jgi:hypothetical protein
LWEACMLRPVSGRRDRKTMRKASNLNPLGWCLAAAALIVPGCKKDEDLSKESGAAPPPIESSRAGACASGGGTVKDQVAAPYLPRAAGDYCLDPNGETRAYGADAAGNLDQVCTELFNGECEIYKGHGLDRVVTVRYIDGKGSPGSVALNLSRFKSREGAYSFYTRRLISEADPASTSLVALDPAGTGALGAGIAYVWRGQHVGELSYANELEAPDQLKATGQRVLPPLARKLGEVLPGEKLPPAAVQALPEAHRVPLGSSYELSSPLGVSGAGPGALGFYREGKKRWRALSLVSSDEESAKDVMKTLAKLDGSKTLKPPPLEALALSLRDDDESPRVTWVVARHGSSVFAIGDERYVLDSGQPERNTELSLSQTEKLERLKQHVESRPGK